MNNQPQQIGKYRIDSLLGQGAMGVVYKAFDTEIDRDVAIKILHVHLLTGDMGEEFLHRFSHEVKAAARCQHPNIVTVYDYGINQGSPYMVMEYVKGIDLQIFLQSQQTLTAEQAINLIAKVLDALHSAHTLGIVHRDIKPANIMLLDNGQVKVTDFGVARLDNSDLTRIGDVMGTPSYMSPEARRGGIVTASSDLYAVALVLLELLLNKRVKAKEIDYAYLVSELAAENLAPQFADVLDKALQPDPQQRYSDALEFSKALSACLENSTDHYQIASDLAATVLIVRRSVQQQNSLLQESTDSLFVSATSSQLLQNQLTVVEKNLTHYLGPVAKVLVKKQAKNTSNINQLINSLMTHIPSATERQHFVNSLDFTSTDTLFSNSSLLSMTSKSTALSATFSPDYIDAVIANLTQYLGPVAKHLVKATLKKVSSKEELCHCLAAKIPNDQERVAFLKKCD